MANTAADSDLSIEERVVKYLVSPDSTATDLSMEEEVVQHLAPPENTNTPARKRKSQTTVDSSPSSPSPTKRRCKPHACLNCRKSHIDCGGNIPGTSACKSCTKKGQTCNYGIDERTNSCKKDELVQQIERFKRVVNDYYNVIFSMHLSLTSTVQDSPAAATANLVRAQCSVLAPEAIGRMLAKEGWAYVPSPCYPQFCAAATAMAFDGVKLNDTRKAINQFTLDSLVYVKQLHIAYRILGDRPQVRGDPVTTHIGSTLTNDLMFLDEDFQYLATLDDKPSRSITSEEMAEINRALGIDAQLSTPPRVVVPSLPRVYIDLTGDDTSGEGSSTLSQNTTPAPSHGTGSEAPQAVAHANQPFPASPLPVANWVNPPNMDFDLAGVGHWANTPQTAIETNQPAPANPLPVTNWANPLDFDLDLASVNDWANTPQAAIQTDQPAAANPLPFANWANPLDFDLALADAGNWANAPQTAIETNQPAMANPLPVTNWVNPLDLDLGFAGAGNWVNDPLQGPFTSNPSYTMDGALGFDGTNTFTWPEQDAEEEENIFAESIPGFDLGPASSVYQPAPHM